MSEIHIEQKKSECLHSGKLDLNSEVMPCSGPGYCAWLVIQRLLVEGEFKPSLDHMFSTSKILYPHSFVLAGPWKQTGE